MRRILRTSAILLILVGASGCFGGKGYFYVSPAGNDSNPGTIDRPWKTIQKANQTLQPGDTVFLRRGNYHERIEPIRSGTKDARITYRAHTDEKVTLIGAGDNAVRLSGNDYITIQGFLMDGEDKIFCAIYMEKEADHITIRDCEIRNYRNAKNTGGYGIWVNRKGGSHLTVDKCRIYHCGTTNPKIENGSNIHIFKDSSHITIRNCDIYESHTEDGLHLGAFGLVTDVLVENCRFWGCKENGIDMKSVARVTIRNCDLWASKDSPTGGGSEVVVHMGARDVTFDGCRFHKGRDGLRIQFNAPSVKTPPTQNIRVQNCAFYDCKVGLTVAGGLSRGPAPGKCRDLKFYNNVFYNNETGLMLWAHPGGDVDGVELKNNVFLKNRKQAVYVRKDRVKNFVHDHNNCQGPRGNLADEPNGLAVDPQFADASKKDFRIRATSPLVDKGVDVGLPFADRAPDIGLAEHGLQKK